MLLKCRSSKSKKQDIFSYILSGYQHSLLSSFKMSCQNWIFPSDNASTFLSPHPTPYNYSDTPTPYNRGTAVIYSIVFIVGFLGNTLAIYVMARYSSMNTVTNMYILNLAVADELYILGIPFVGTTSVLCYWPYGKVFCKITMTADGMSQFASTFCLTLMSIDRFFAVVYPVRSAKWRKPIVAKILSGIVWVVSFLIVLPVTIFADVQEFDTCNISWPEPLEVWANVFILYTSILGFFVPLVVIILCYLLIVIKVRSAAARVGLIRRRKSERKVTRMVVIIVLVFVLCWLPFFTANIVNQIYAIPMTDTTTAIYFFLVILTYINSCANPVLYGFLSVNFKQSFQRMLSCKKPNVSKAPESVRTKQNATEPVRLEGNENTDREPIDTKIVMNGQ